MYHTVCRGRNERYVIEPQALDEDLRYIKEAGYTTITIQDLIDFQENNFPLPEKPIMLTFDDGNRTNYIHAFPLLKKYGLKAVISVVGAYVDSSYLENGEVSPLHQIYLTYEQIKEMHNSGLVEIQNHSYNLHGKHGSKNKKGESAEAYHARLMSDLTKLQKACEIHLGYIPSTFVYPLGAIGKNSRQVLENIGMKASLGCEEGVNIVRQGDKDCLFKMRRYNRPSGKSIENILKSLPSPKQQ